MGSSESYSINTVGSPTRHTQQNGIWREEELKLAKILLWRARKIWRELESWREGHWTTTTDDDRPTTTTTVTDDASIAMTWRPRRRTAPTRR